MEHQNIYEIPLQDSARETVAVEINNFSESDNGGVSPKVIYVRVKFKGKDHMCCSVFNIMFCNCLCLGLAALICSLKARSKMNEGDSVEAQKYSRRACRTNTAAVIVTIIALTIFLVFVGLGTFHNFSGHPSAVSHNSGTSFSSELSFDNIEWQKSKPRNSYDRRSESSGYNSYQPKGNINRTPQRNSYSGGRWKG